MPELFGNVPIRTIGLYQPYASLMLHDKVETRWVIQGKTAPFPLGMYLIYATQKRYSDTQFRSIAGCWHKSAELKLATDPTKSLTGHAIAVGELVARFPFSDREYYSVSECDTFVDVEDPTYFDEKKAIWKRLWCLKFADVKRIKPFRFSGQQGVGYLDKSFYFNKIEYVS